MEISKIIYYTRQDDKSLPLSLRNLCPKDENKGLETIFYLVKDATDIQDFLGKWHDTYYNRIELESETPSYIRFKEIDIYDNTNYFKLKKSIHTETTYENNWRMVWHFSRTDKKH